MNEISGRVFKILFNQLVSFLFSLRFSTLENGNTTMFNSTKITAGNNVCISQCSPGKQNQFIMTRGLSSNGG